MTVGLLATTTTSVLAFVLLAAGISKLRRPAGVAEVSLAVAGLALPTRLAGPGLALVFTAFCTVHLRALRSEPVDCGCIGHQPLRSHRRAAVLTATGAGAAAVAAALPGPSLVGLAEHGAARTALVLAAAVGLALLWWLAFTGAGLARGLDRAGERLIESSALFLERRLSRRTMLIRLATAGSALSVAPLRYLLYPGTALAAIAPGDCSGGLCTDGYTAFCCEINQGLNSCPEGTFTGGWWMCTDYPGHRLCAEQGVRYYVDCNRLPGVAFPGGCHCANNDCDHRRVACNVFRYGQCNPQISGVTEVVCRMVVCENPSLIPSLNCANSLAIDNAVCDHDVPCLDPQAVELAGAGGV